MRGGMAPPPQPSPCEGEGATRLAPSPCQGEGWGGGELVERHP